jgi:hypothetical protein
MKRLTILLILLSSVCGAENYFVGNPNVVAYWDFGHATDPYGDRTGNGNDLYRQGYVDVETTDKKEGDACGDWEIADGDDLYILDADLSADFPGKNGTTNNVFSVTGWFKLESVGAQAIVASKYGGGAGTRSWAIGVNSSNYFAYYWGYNSGNSVYSYTESDHAIQAGEWWFFKVVYDDPSNVCSSHVYDADGDKWWDESNTPANALNIEAEEFFIGRLQDSGNYFDGLIDDLCIFDRVVDNTDANSIAAGTFDFDTESNLVSRYRFNLTGLGYDDEENNHLPNASYPNQVGPNANIKSAYFDADYPTLVYLTDAELSSDFLGKNGSGNDVGSFCFWVKIEPQSADGWVIQKGKTTGTDYGYGFMSERYGDQEMASRFGNGEYATSGITPTSGRWYHVGCVVDADNTRLYIRLWDDTGETVYTDDNTSASFSRFFSTDPFRIGRGDYGDEDFDGWLAEMVWFDKVLTDEEIDQIRNGTYGEAPDVSGVGGRIMRIIMPRRR